MPNHHLTYLREGGRLDISFSPHGGYIAEEKDELVTETMPGIYQATPTTPPTIIAERPAKAFRWPTWDRFVTAAQAIWQRVTTDQEE